MRVKLINHPTNSKQIVYTAMRTCYSEKSPIDIFNEDEPNMKLISNIIASGHHSTIEHLTYTFAIEGISRDCSLQLVRHRLCSFSQKSQRYVSMDDCDFVVPDGLSQEAYTIIGEALAKCKGAYQQLIDLGVKKEDARIVLPGCTSTDLVMTCNIRELIHICNLRLCTAAQREIRDLVKEMVKAVLYFDPWLKDYLVPQCESLGYCPEPEKRCCGRKERLEDLLTEQYNMGVSVGSVG